MKFHQLLFTLVIFNLCQADEPIGKDILLIINYNHPHYDSIPFLQELYQPYFPNIVFTGPGNHSQVESCDHENGYYAYKALAPIMKKHPDYAGYLWINDDCVINPWNFTRLDTTKIWCVVPSGALKLEPNATQGWGWWQKQVGYQNTKNAYDKLSEKHKATLTKSCGEHAILVGLVEVAYIPAKYRQDAIELATLFAHEHSFIEIAFATICACLDEKENWELLNGRWQYGDPNPLATYTKQLDYLHPVKFSAQSNQDFIRAQFINKGKNEFNAIVPTAKLHNNVDTFIGLPRTHWHRYSSDY